jgi:DNA repair protein RadD
MFELRPYQHKLLDDIRDAIRSGHKRVLAVMPTGSGKGVTIAALVHAAAQKQSRVWILVHRAELVADLSQRLAFCGIEHGIIASGVKPKSDLAVQVGSVQTVVRRIGTIPEPDIIIQDEAHHVIKGNSWGKVIESYPDVILIGKTATPERLDQRGLGEPDGLFQAMILGPTAQWLTDEGFLARAKVYCPPRSDNTKPKMRVKAGDYDMRDAADAYGREIFGDAIAHYRKHIYPGTAISFCCSVQHAKDVAEAFNADGIAAESLDGKQSVEHRKAVLARLSSGETKVVTSCMIISEGTDVPSVGGCILLRPTMSLALHLQMVGRCLRPKSNGGHAVILDHVGNVQRHGFPTDPREWSLQGRKDRELSERGKAPGVRTCPECFAALPAGTPTCTACGHEFAPEPVQLDQVDGELVELAPTGYRPGDPVTIGGGTAVILALQEMNPDSQYSPSGVWHIAGPIDSKGNVRLTRNPHDARAVAAGRGDGIYTYRAKSRWLSPVQPEQHRPVAASKGAGSLDQLLAVERQRGYKSGWAARVWQARMAKRGSHVTV